MSRQRVLPSAAQSQAQQGERRERVPSFPSSVPDHQQQMSSIPAYNDNDEHHQRKMSNNSGSNHSHNMSNAPRPGSSGMVNASPPRQAQPSMGRSRTRRDLERSEASSNNNNVNSRRAPPFQIDEEAILKEYGLSTLQPDVWEDTNPPVSSMADMPGGPPSAGAARARSTAAMQGQDEADALGLYRGTVLSNVPDLPPEIRSTVLLSSKSFSPSSFLSHVHPSATPDDLAYGHRHLSDSIESRSGALQRLVEENFDRFVGVKQATGLVYEEMKSGPLKKEGDYSVNDLRESLKLAQNKADAVWSPILEARLKADRLRSTLGIFERSKFFFTLPGLLSESISQGRYDSALVAYKKGKYLLDSRPGALLGLPPGTTMTEQQSEKHRRVFEKVWGQVEKTMADLRSMLGKRLRDPRRALEEVEKTIEILLELDPTSDPVWIYFDTQHHHIMQVLRNSHAHTVTKFQNVMKRMVSPSSTEDNARATDLKTCLLAMDTPAQDSVLEKGAEHEVWKSLLELVHNLCEILLQTIPNFWKVAKGYMDGKYQRKDSSNDRKKHHNAHRGDDNNSGGGRRNPTQVRVMTNEIINLYISLFSELLTLSSSMATSPRLHDGSGQEANLPALPTFVPPNSNALTTGFYLLKALSELSDCTNDIGGLANIGIEIQNNLKDFLSTVRFRFLESICAVWVRDAKLFWRLEDWTLDNEDLSRTVYLRRIENYLRGTARLAYRASGGNEERASNLFIEGKGIALLRRMGNENIPPEFARKIHTTYLDALYDFLDGLVHVAFLDKAQSVPKVVTANGSEDEMEPLSPGKAEQIDVQNRDVRILLTVSNLTHFKSDFIPKVADQLQTALKIEMKNDSKTLNDVVSQLDKILFDDHIKGRSVLLAKTIEKGVLGNGVDWLRAPKPTEVHSYIYDALLSLVLVHAQVTAIARSLVTRTVGSLVEEVAKHALSCFSQVQSFGMGGMLQATLEMEFLHQTLNTHVSSNADATLQEIYKIISAAYKPPPSSSSEGANELQKELEQLKMTLTQARRATALQFLCFRERRAQTAQAASGGQSTPTGTGAPARR